MLKGRYEEARNNLLKLHTPEEAGVEFTQIRLQVEVDKNLKDSYWAMFANRNYRKRTLIGMGTFASIQTSAILVINSEFYRINSIYGHLLTPSNRLRPYGQRHHLGNHDVCLANIALDLWHAWLRQQDATLICSSLAHPRLGWWVPRPPCGR